MSSIYQMYLAKILATLKAGTRRQTRNTAKKLVLRINAMEKDFLNVIKKYKKGNNKEALKVANHIFIGVFGLDHFKLRFEEKDKKK